MHSRQRAHLLKELRGLADAWALAAGSAVGALLVTAAELHIRADLGVVDAAEQTLHPEVLAGLGAQPSPGTPDRAGSDGTAQAQVG